MRPVRGTVGRRACVCTAQWNAVGRATRSKQYPPLTYSVNRRDVTGAELGMLLAASHSEAMVGPGAIPLCRQTYSYWRSLEGLHHAAKLEVALRRSVFMVACFTTWDVYGDTTSSCRSGSGAALGYPSGGAGGGGTQSQSSYPSSGSQWEDANRDQPPPVHLQQPWQPQEEECPLTAAQHERERERGQPHRWAQSRGSPSLSSSWSDPSPRGTLLPDGSASTSATSPSSMSSPSSNPFMSSFRSSSPSSPSAAAAAAARTSQPSDSLGVKSSTPPGVPDMDWNWLLPSGGGRSSNDSTNSSRSSGGGGSSSGGRSPSPPSTAPSSQHPPPPGHSWQWPARSSSPSSASPLSPSSSAAAAPSHPPRKSLVGFARAMGDNSLVATIYDVAVHPAVRNQGIGRRLVKLLVQQVQSRSVYDIGVVTPAAAAGFWERSSFGDDREGSTFMTFMGRPTGHHLTADADIGEEIAAQELESYGGFGAPRGTQELLEVADLGCWDAAQRSEPLRALLAAKLQRSRREAEADVMGSGGSWARTDDGGGGSVKWGRRANEVKR